MENKNSSPKIRALAKHVRMSAHRARRVINQIRSRSYEQALMILEFMPYRACYPILQLIPSAAANANHNMGLNKANLFVSRAEVNEGAVLKRSRPRAQGRGYPIQKPTCHITIVLEERDRSKNLIMPTEPKKGKYVWGRK
uniref:Large ribosomal subunit protein uL22c n=1 Tax=Ceratozamia hildae TaxID=171009 RepID=A0A0A6Z7J0_CERHI|nr:ribosomal protein L22 [Ceratozamia hildae]AFR13793.1 ribosomal protein L22 [Ceratozamia hildae]BAR93501.1 ribosomal protein L22 [Ceratozamia hildae]